MLLAIDIGNTSISIGVFSGDELVFTSKLTTIRLKSSDEYASLIANTFNLHSRSVTDVKNAVLLSVVPTLTHTLTAALDIFGIKTLVVGSGIKTGLNIRVESPSQVGTDIISNCVGALCSFPAPLIVLDMGTASTVSVVDNNRMFIGCAITSGVKLSADALSSGCALLPDTTLHSPVSVIGKNSSDSINSGIMYGHAFMLNGFVERIIKENGLENPSIVACGGFSKLIAPLMDCKVNLMPDLSLYGLKKIFEINNR